MTTAAFFVARLRTFADELVQPMLCTQPAYGAPGFPHCAACCYGTGLIITCDEDQAIADAAKALNRAADLIEQASDTKFPAPALAAVEPPSRAVRRSAGSGRQRRGGTPPTSEGAGLDPDALEAQS